MATSLGPRPFSSDFQHSTDTERWIAVYPLYINRKRSREQGRKISTNKAVDNPTIMEIKDACEAVTKLNVVVEDKVHPSEPDKYLMPVRGRLRVQIKNDNGTPINEKFPNRVSVLHAIAETIPKLKTRQGQAPSQGSGQGAKKNAKAKKGGRR